jgi:uncharacterized protein YkwD
MLRRVTLGVTLCAAMLCAAAPAQGAQATGLIAPVKACPNQDEPRAAAGAQLRAMHCMTNYAREARGLPSLHRVGALDLAAKRKAGDMLSCREFSHTACDREFTYWMEQGYLPAKDCWRAAENIAWGNGPLGSVRSIFSAWIRSAGHRRNILAPEFHDLGVGLRIGTLDGNAGAHVWTQAFGSRDC